MNGTGIDSFCCCWQQGSELFVLVCLSVSMQKVTYALLINVAVNVHVLLQVYFQHTFWSPKTEKLVALFSVKNWFIHLFYIFVAHGGLRCRWDHLIPSWGWPKPTNGTQTLRKWTWVWGHTGTTAANHLFSAVSARYVPLLCHHTSKPSRNNSVSLNLVTAFQTSSDFGGK